MKKVVIDARLAGLENAGIGRYIQSLVEEFRVQSSEFRLKIQTISPKIKHYSLSEQISLVTELLALKPDLVHFPHFNVPLLYNKPFVVTIHDLLWHERVGFSATTLPKWLYLIKYLGYRMVLRHAVLGSKAIIVPSEWVKKKVLERFAEVGGKVNVIYEGVSGVFRESNNSYKSYKDYSFPYIVYTGSLYPHKNLGVVLNVLKHFSDLKLVAACARSVFWERFKQEVRDRKLGDRVVLAGFVPDEELAVLYKKAVAFVFPSLSEGFGLPGLEAMAAGCPVISSFSGALPEIYGDAAVYFDPSSEEDLIRAIRKIRDNRRFREKMIGLGKDRAKMFSWEKCARETLGVYESCLGLRPDK